VTIFAAGAIVGGAFFTIRLTRDILIRVANKLTEEE
jgi:hypothetical protein